MRRGQNETFSCYEVFCTANQVWMKKEEKILTKQRKKIGYDTFRPRSLPSVLPASFRVLNDLRGVFGVGSPTVPPSLQLFTMPSLFPSCSVSWRCHVPLLDRWTHAWKLRLDLPVLPRSNKFITKEYKFCGKKNE